MSDRFPLYYPVPPARAGGKATHAVGFTLTNDGVEVNLWKWNFGDLRWARVPISEFKNGFPHDLPNWFPVLLGEDGGCRTTVVNARGAWKELRVRGMVRGDGT